MRKSAKACSAACSWRVWSAVFRAYFISWRSWVSRSAASVRTRSQSREAWVISDSRRETCARAASRSLRTTIPTTICGRVSESQRDRLHGRGDKLMDNPSIDHGLTTLRSLTPTSSTGSTTTFLYSFGGQGARRGKQKVRPIDHAWHAPDFGRERPRWATASFIGWMP